MNKEFVGLKFDEEVGVIVVSKYDWTLFAVGGSSSVYIVRLEQGRLKYTPTILMTIPLTSRPISIDFTTSKREGSIELAVACSDQRLRYISTISPFSLSETEITPFWSNRSKINQIEFCSISGYQHYLGVVSDDKTLTIWNTATSKIVDPDPDSSILTISGDPFSNDFERVPNSLNIQLSHPSPSLSFSPTKSNHLVILNSDPSFPSLLIKDWLGNLAPNKSQDDQIDPSKVDHNDKQPGETVLTLRYPQAIIGAKGRDGSVQWHPRVKDVFGAIWNDGSWAVWDLKISQGGLPSLVGSFSDSRLSLYKFRWSPTNPRLFAILDSKPGINPPLKLISMSFPQSPKNIYVEELVTLASSISVTDFDWVPVPGEGQVVVVTAGRWIRFVKVAD